MWLSPFVAARLRRAFPRAARPDARAVVRMMPDAPFKPSEDTIGPVIVGGERVAIPMRIYYPEPPAAAVAALSERQRVIFGCLYTRHNDGHVRERSLVSVIGSDHPWVAPFVVQLVGEYVIEIVRIIAAHRDRLERPDIVAFVRENPAFLELTRQRMTSYWNCYFRRSCPHLTQHVGHHVMEALSPKDR
jgi:hypothetical protein